MNYSKEQFMFLYSQFERIKRLAKIKMICKKNEMNNCEKLINNLTYSIENGFEVLAKNGIHKEQYEIYVKNHWLLHLENEMHNDCYLSCYVRMRFAQDQIKENKTESLTYKDMEPPCFNEGNPGCGPNCTRFKRVTEEQEFLYRCGKDIDTSEQII